MKIRMRRDFNGLVAGREYDVADGDAETLLVARVADRVTTETRDSTDGFHGRIPQPTNRDNYVVVTN